MRFLLFISRLIVGLVFCFSGFVKAVDPWGSCYKFTDYFNYAFDMPALAGMSLPLAFILSALEFTTGVMLIFKLRSNIAAWLALGFMILFTPLTLYLAIKNPVHDCGCFGDAIVLTNWETFYKNLILCVFVVFIFIKRKMLENKLSDNVELALAIVVFIIGIVFQHFMVRHLPIIDFRPYKVGTYIPEKMVYPEGAKTDVIEHLFIMENTQTGERKKFTVEEYPSDTELWKYVDREDRVIEEGYRPPIHDFTMVPPEDSTGTDYVPMLMEYENPVLLVVMHKLSKADEDGLEMLKELEQYAQRKEYVIGALTSSNLDEINAVKDKYQITMQFFNTDDITLKTIVRANPGIVLLQKGVVKGKWNFRDFKFD